jgi:uncharacterized protein (TIGR02246 family)
MSKEQHATVEQEIRALYEAWGAAIRGGDADWHRRAFVEDFIYIDIHGNVRDRENVIRMNRGAQREEVEIHEIRVRLFPGDLAIVHGHYYARVRRDANAEFSPRLQEIFTRGVTLRFTTVWQKQDGSWRGLAHHETEEQV